MAVAECAPAPSEMATQRRDKRRCRTLLLDGEGVEHTVAEDGSRTLIGNEQPAIGPALLRRRGRIRPIRPGVEAVTDPLQPAGIVQLATDRGAVDVLEAPAG